MSYHGKYVCKNPNKYQGNFQNIQYRSLWERRVMVYLDENPSIIAWSSEEVVIPYISPKDGRQHRYFVDFYLKVQKPDGITKEYLWEVKPHKETIPPVAKTRTEVLAETKGARRKYYLEVIKYGINNAKWEAARAYCESRNWTFQTVTEKHLASMVGLKK